MITCENALQWLWSFDTANLDLHNPKWKILREIQDLSLSNEQLKEKIKSLDTVGTSKIAEEHPGFKHVNDLDKAELRLFIANTYIQRKDLETARSHITSVLEFPNTIPHIQAIALWMLGNLYWFSENTQKAHLYWLRTREIFRTLYISIEKSGFEYEAEWQDLLVRERTENRINRGTKWYGKALHQINQHMIIFPEEASLYINQFIAAGNNNVDFPIEIFPYEVTAKEIEQWINPDGSHLSLTAKRMIQIILNSIGKREISTRKSLSDLLDFAKTVHNYQERGEILLRCALIYYHLNHFSIAVKLTSDAILTFPPFSHQKMIARWLHGIFCWQKEETIPEAIGSWETCITDLKHLTLSKDHDQFSFESNWYAYYCKLLENGLNEMITIHKPVDISVLPPDQRNKA
ncbi:MAG: hypothetical protein JEZ06_01955 [Anaerolineaceae bacterium]|nr:hypothetical protein [Anaerolineaceae bacterium]